MKNGWTTKRLEEVCVIEKNQGLYSELPYVGMEHIEPNTGRFIGTKTPSSMKSTTFKFSPYHVLYGRLRPYLNKVLVPDFEGHCSTEIFPLKPGPELSRVFLQYWLLHSDTVNKINATSTGARMPRANMNHVMRFKIPIPALDEQKRIVSILDESFKAIDIAKANAEKNLQNARALFESYLDNIFLKQSRDWQPTTLGKIYDVRDGTHDSPKYQESGHPLITSKNLKSCGLSFEKVNFISETDFENINKRSAVSKGDVLFAMIGTIGNPTLVEIEPNFAIKNVALFKVPQNQSSLFLKYYLESARVIRKMHLEAKGTTQKFVGLGYLRQFPFRIPSLPMQNQIVKKLGDIESETKRLESIYQKKLASLEELKKSLLYQAFNGEL